LLPELTATSMLPEESIASLANVGEVFADVTTPAVPKLGSSVPLTS